MFFYATAGYGKSYQVCPACQPKKNSERAGKQLMVAATAGGRQGFAGYCGMIFRCPALFLWHL